MEIERYKVEEGQEVTPVVVLTSTIAEYEDFLRITGRTKEQALAVKQPFQLALYPDLEVVHYGDYWLNSAYGSLEYKQRMEKQALEDYENSSR